LHPDDVRDWLRYSMVDWPDADPLARRAIESMPLRWRNVVTLLYGHGLTQEECAERLGLSPRTVRRTVSEVCDFVAATLAVPQPPTAERGCVSAGSARWGRG
jgi:DNA-directed RNA polymerase specialized sigma24 family protein